ncbi:MAG: hypothetical protein M1814_001004 [Vezdaea aestivalis]|nr:MAG: hypothetical protein M1814_001004 [Vezdaea aestivalis]
MGSVVIADVVTDSALFPRNMMSGSGHQSSQQNLSFPSSSSSATSTDPPRPPHPQPRTTPIQPSSTLPPTHAAVRTVPGAHEPTPQSTPQAPPQAETQGSSIRHNLPSQQETPHSATVTRPSSQITPPETSRLQHTPSSEPKLNASAVYRSPHAPSLGLPPPNRIVVRDLAHIQSFASDDLLLSQGSHGSGLGRNGNEAGPQYEISEMPVEHIIEMVAGLLTKITTTNDRQHENLHRNIPPPEGQTGLSQQTTSVLAFHGRNVPSITIMSYLSRIHKYCPTTYEVFLSLLVYFDRMTERVNSGPMQNLQQQQQGEVGEEKRNTAEDVTMTDASRESSPSITDSPEGDPLNVSHFFVVDSFNIHRLVIAGVTCASKFFSDVFYTNSRYAKVGGLPLPELNHLELQFLLLNDFRLFVPVEELEAYGTMLVEFYAREVLAQRRAMHPPPTVPG